MHDQDSAVPLSLQRRDRLQTLTIKCHRNWNGVKNGGWRAICRLARGALRALSAVIAGPRRKTSVAGNCTVATSTRGHRRTAFDGWLGRGSMFVLSEAGARRLVGAAGARCGGAIVDVGAGDGEVSRRFAHLYSDKFATEISSSMRKALKSKGYTLLDTEDWHGSQFDCVCMLNLVDRCSHPRAMLRSARAALAPGGVLLLALVLPYKPYVEATADHKPVERLPIEGATFEEQVGSFVAFMRESGFELRSWSRAPYLCEGDFAQAYYWLDDSVYVFAPLEAAK
ncbi:unnamed protein product, partial [Iphiclides podalirius]